MCFTKEDLKNLKPDGENTYSADLSLCSKAEIQRLKELDDSVLFIQGYHLITNYKELQFA